MRTRSSLWCAAATSLALASPAAADSIVYVGADRQVWLVSPDGARTHQVTRDGDAKHRSPSQDDQGMIVAARVDQSPIRVRPSDGVRDLLFNVMKPSLSALYPVTAHVSPGGALVTYHTVDPEARPTYLRVGVTNSTGWSTLCRSYPCTNGYAKPRWIPGTDKIGMISADGELAVRDGDGVHDWLSADGGTIRSFDVSRTGNLVLLTGTFDDAASLIVWRNDGPPPGGGGGEIVCEIGGFSGDAARWSPDASQIAWDDPQGVWVSPAPRAGACSLAPRLLAAGGSQPDWGPADVPGAEPTPEPTPVPTVAPPPTRPDVTPPALTVSAPGRLRLGQLRRSGVALQVRCSEACTVTGELSLDAKAARRIGLTRRRQPVTLATATVRAPASLKLVLKRAAARRLARLRTGDRLRVSLTAVDEAGNRSPAVTRAVRVRR